MPARRGPELALEAGSVRVAGERGRWLVAWHIRSRTRERLRILAARLPHDHFFGAERQFSPPLVASAAGEVALELAVACADRPGAVIDNAFLILRVEWRRAAWLVFARLRVTVDAAGVPVARCERVTAERVRARP